MICRATDNVANVTWLEFYAAKYVPYRKSRGKLKPSTDHEYRVILNVVQNWASSQGYGTLWVRHFSDELLEEYFYWLANEAPPCRGCPRIGRAADTVAKHQRHLLALWAFACKSRHWKRDVEGRPDPPDLDPIKTPKKTPRARTIDEINRIITTASTLTGTIVGIPTGDWWVACLSTLYYTSLRQRVLFSLRSDSYDPTTRILHADAENQKQFADQDFRLSPECADALLRIYDPSRRLLFPWPYDRRGRYAQTFVRHYKAIEAAAGVRPIPWKPLHAWRRASLSYTYAAQGREAAIRKGGHSDFSVTARYLDPQITGICADATGMPAVALPAPVATV